MKIIKFFIKIMHTRYKYLIAQGKNKTSKDILRVVLRPAQPENMSACHGCARADRAVCHGVSCVPKERGRAGPTVSALPDDIYLRI
jgi:hypothetical protein